MTIETTVMTANPTVHLLNLVVHPRQHHENVLHTPTIALIIVSRRQERSVVSKMRLALRPLGLLGTAHHRLQQLWRHRTALRLWCQSQRTRELPQHRLVGRGLR